MIDDQSNEVKEGTGEGQRAAKADAGGQAAGDRDSAGDPRKKL